MSQTHLHFDMHIGRQKPENIRNQVAACPFCRLEELDGILERRGEMKDPPPAYANRRVGSV
ncbi:DUF4931 domain-containing protein [Brevibacillus borstelensis]|uniref:DUF4931 domain-containing protein n=1 Tax=Brevibacillus borstelensis TaxID=45462 RepID=UPI003CC91D23